MLLLDLLPQDGIEVKKVAATHGGEYAGPCPLCGGVDRFRVWPEEGDGGTWWCRGCEKGGDIIQYLREVRKLSYQEACFTIGKKPEPMKRSFDWGRPANSKSRKWKPRETAMPPGEWIRKCSAFVDWCHEVLLKDASICAYLNDKRGLREDTIKVFHLGWNPQNLSRGRKSWGLSEDTGKDGKVKEIWLPQGVVIPFYADGILQRARIRRLDQSCQNPKKGPNYCVVSGSSTRAMVLGDNRKIFVVVESEFDGILLHQEIGDTAGIIALGSAQVRPDKHTAELLCDADLILISLDSDDKRDDGQNPGAKEAWGWWLKHFGQAKRLPPIGGKDPGEMWKAGVDLNDWIRIGIEKYQQKEEETMALEITRPVLDTATPIREAINPPLDSVTQGSDPISQATDPIDHPLEQISMNDQLMAAYTLKLDDIASKYPSGFYKWVQENMPDVYKEISSDDDWLNEVWKLCLEGRATAQDFQSALDLWYEGLIEAICSYHLYQQNQHSLLNPATPE